MANNGNKKIIVKKDMNFFAEFTASAAKVAVRNFMKSQDIRSCQLNLQALIMD